VAFDATCPIAAMTKYLGSAGGGGSAAQVFGDSDGVQYVVKFKENSQGLRVLANEFVVNKLALFLEVPVPQGAIIQIPVELIGVTPILSTGRGTTGPISSGPHFGVRRLINFWRNPPPDALSKIKNKDDVPGIFVLDLLGLNTDRKPEHLIILKPDYNHTVYVVSAIDHGHCFGVPNWDITIEKKIDVDNLQITPGLMECVIGANPFKPFLDRLAQLDKATIDQIISQIPADWGVSPEERTALGSFLDIRKGKIGDILIKNKNKFPHWI